MDGDSLSTLRRSRKQARDLTFLEKYYESVYFVELRCAHYELSVSYIRQDAIFAEIRPMVSTIIPIKTDSTSSRALAVSLEKFLNSRSFSSQSLMIYISQDTIQTTLHEFSSEVTFDSIA